MDERLNGSYIIKDTSFLNAFKPFRWPNFLKLPPRKISLESRGMVEEPTQIEILPFATKLQNLFFFLSWLSDMRFQIVFFIMIQKSLNFGHFLRVESDQFHPTFVFWYFSEENRRNGDIHYSLILQEEGNETTISRHRLF